ncbi:MAG: CoA-binding protein [Armatimonadetes bacterium]|nr:CoA-binding protein [Armatimonadota bacterium]
MELTVDQVRDIFTTSKTIAVVGLSNKPDRPSNEIASYLKEQGYRIIPVNPTITEALGEKAYPSLKEIPERVDVVQIFRRPEEVPAVVDDAIAIGAKVVWMQPGAENEEAAAKAEAAGLKAVVGACMRSVHRTLPH